MFLERVNQYYERLNKTDLHIVTIILENLQTVDKMGVEELAKKCNTSRTSILRVAKKLEFSGYGELRNYLKWNKETVKETEWTNLNDSVKTDFLMTCSHLENTRQLESISGKIHKSKQVFIYGSGQAQRYCAQELQRLFMQIGKHMYVINASEEFALVTKELSADDLVIVISLSGDLKKIESSVRQIKMRTIPLVSITGLGNNKLAAAADLSLYAVASPLEITNELIHYSFSSFFVVIDYLFRTYLEKYY